MKLPSFAGSSGDVSQEDANKRAKLLLLGLVAVVLVAALFFFVVKPMLSKSSSTAATTPATSATGTTNPPAAALTPTPKPKASPTVEPLSGSTRDPFAPLPAAEVAVTTTIAPVLPSVTADPAPAATPSPSGAHSLTLVTLTSGSADVTFDGKDKTVKAGGTIATGVACVKVTDDSIFITYQSKAYAIAPGQTVSF